MDNTLNNQFLDEDDAMYQMLTDFDEEDQDTSSEDAKDFEYKLSSDTNLYRYLKAELQIIEPSRSFMKFRTFSDGNSYEGKVLKEIDKDNFIFLLDKPEKKMKKFDINDIEVLI